MEKGGLVENAKLSQFVRPVYMLEKLESSCVSMSALL